ncbi:WD40 repeat domain-containing protein, partial [Streptomyces sp. NPDC053750]|uniref:WD40 repeat domain-containing protein n=1 Tax=Streptomyces sp. NPDC053750 TaxID=3365714 RepID=UPI0037D5BCCF
MAKSLAEEDGAQAYETLLQAQGERLRLLRVHRGNPTYRDIQGRAAGIDPVTVLSLAALNKAFTGKPVAEERLILLVRTLLSWDETGEDRPAPGPRSPELKPWRAQFRRVAAAQPLRRPKPSGGGQSHAEQLFRRGVLHGRLPEIFRAEEKRVRAMAFSPDSSELVIASYATVLWDLTTGTFSHFRGHEDVVASVAISPDGTWVADGSRDELIHVHDLTTRERLASLTSNPVWMGPGDDPLMEMPLDYAVTSVAFAPNGMLASGSIDATVRLW